MKVIIDEREQSLYEKCYSIVNLDGNCTNVQLSKKVIPLGDILINTDEDKPVCIIERKSLSDLAASIKDGRYEEQSYRLKNLWHHNHNIIYLIEGDFNRFNSFRDRIDKQTLYSAMVSINYYKGFSVWRTTSIEETALVVCNMAYKLGKDKTKLPFYSNDLIKVNDQLVQDKTDDTVVINEQQVTASEKDYCTVVKKVKKDNITTENIGEIMLCQIPGVSSTSALAILAQFKTLPNLIKSIETDETCLTNIATIDANGKSRKISKTAIATIIKFLKA